MISFGRGAADVTTTLASPRYSLMNVAMASITPGVSARRPFSERTLKKFLVNGETGLFFWASAAVNRASSPFARSFAEIVGLLMNDLRDGVEEMAEEMAVRSWSSLLSSAGDLASAAL
jgi:hypothetical protein